MATTYEQSCVMTFKDSSDNLHKMYPVTKKDNVIGIDEAIRDQSVTTTGNGSAYKATVDGITSLSAGVSFMMVPHVTSEATSPTLNVNSLGAVNIRRRVSSSTGTTSAGYSADWLSAGKPVRVTYDGSFWIVDLVKPNAIDIIGTVAISNGGTGATTAAAARSNLGAVAKTTATATLSASSWSGNTQTVAVSGVTTSNVVIPSPDADSYVAYCEAVVRCTAQAADSLTFTCTETPTVDLTVNVLIIT